MEPLSLLRNARSGATDLFRGLGDILLGLLAKVRAQVQQPGAARPPTVNEGDYFDYFFPLSSRIVYTSSIRARRLSGGRSLGWMVCFPV